MNRRRAVTPLGHCFVALYAAVVLFGIHEKATSAHDPGNYIFGIKYGWDVADSRPHLPGSPLLVLAGQGINLVLNDPHYAIIVLNVLFMIGAVYLTVYAGTTDYFRSPSLLLLGLLITNPVVLYYSSVTEVYAADAFFCAFILFTFIRANSRSMPVVFLVIGLIAGVRLSAPILTAPALIYMLYHHRPDQTRILNRANYIYLTQCIALLFVGISIWFITYYCIILGLDVLMTIYGETANMGTTIYQDSATFFIMGIWLINVGLFFFLRRPLRMMKLLSSINDRGIFLLTVIIPPSLFFIFYHYAKGYILLIAPALVLIVAAVINRLPRYLTYIVVLLNIGLFLIPLYVPVGIDATMPKERRSISERLLTMGKRGLSSFLPTLIHIRRSDECIEDAMFLINDHCPNGSIIAVDKSASQLTHMRSLQIQSEQDTFVSLHDYGKSLVDYYTGKTFILYNPIGKLLASPRYFLLTDTRYWKQYGDHSLQYYSGRYLTLIPFDSSRSDVFRKHFTRSESDQ